MNTERTRAKYEAPKLEVWRLRDLPFVEQGTHDELLALKGTYWQLYNSYGRM